MEPQFSQLKWFYPDSISGDVDKFYTDGLNAYRSLIDNWPDKCGSKIITHRNKWTNVLENKWGWTDKCDAVCAKIDNLSSPADFGEVLASFVTVALDSFTNGE